MASKGLKFKKYTFEFKRMIVDLFLNQKWTLSQISKTYHIPEGTISTWVYRINHNVDIYKNNNLGKTRNTLLEKILKSKLKY